MNHSFYTCRSKLSRLEMLGVPTSASLSHLAEALCSMPNLTDLKLHGKDFQEEFLFYTECKGVQPYRYVCVFVLFIHGMIKSCTDEAVEMNLRSYDILATYCQYFVNVFNVLYENVK